MTEKNTGDDPLLQPKPKKHFLLFSMSLSKETPEEKQNVHGNHLANCQAPSIRVLMPAVTMEGSSFL